MNHNIEQSNLQKQQEQLRQRQQHQERLAKRIAESGVASRREAERLILDNHVKVDGNIVNTPVFFVTKENKITIDDKPIREKSAKVSIWKLYKPAGVITSRRDSKGRPTVFDFFPKVQDRLLYVGRLDCNSEGLLLFVNNGDLARAMELPVSAIKRTYRARIFGKFPANAKEKLKKGVVIDKIKYGAVDIIEENFLASHFDSNNSKKNKWITITLSEGKNREVRKLMQYFGCEVSRLIRISYGPFALGNLRPGEVEKVSDKDVKHFLAANRFISF